MSPGSLGAAAAGPAVSLGAVPVGPGAPLALIAGPCVLEDREATLRHAEHLRARATAHGFALIFKASFDKANRTRLDSPRGPGLQAGLRLLEEVKRELGLAVLTDVHDPSQCRAAAEVVDVLQIPAFLSRQTDLLVAAGATGRAVNVKKGQFLAAEDVGFALEKVRAECSAPVVVTERGTTYGPRELVVDFRNLEILRRFSPVVFDATHAVQRPGQGTGTSGGARVEAPRLARAAVAVGVDALFVEVHPEPDAAPSDGPNSLDYALFEQVLTEARAFETVRLAVGASV